jgi:RNA ligase
MSGKNKIVVDYDIESLFCLGMVNHQTQKEINRLEVEKWCQTNEFPIVDKFSKTLSECIIDDRKNAEGVVLTYPSTGLKIKIKIPDYVRLHKILTGLNIRSVWELMRDGKEETINEWLTDPRMPETFKTWVKGVWLSLTEQYETIYNEVNLIYVNRPTLDQFMPYKESRKKMAEYFTQEKYRQYSGLLFGLLDNKNIETMIWKMIEPSGNVVYRADGE